MEKLKSGWFHDRCIGTTPQRVVGRELRHTPSGLQAPALSSEAPCLCLSEKFAERTQSGNISAEFIDIIYNHVGMIFVRAGQRVESFISINATDPRT